MGGQLGKGTMTNSFVPVTVSGITNAVAISAGYYFNCAVLGDSTVQCWGNGVAGVTGTDALVPVAVVGISSAVAVSAGYGSTRVVLNGGTVQCWGDTSFGQLGNGTTTNSSLPVTATGF